MQNHKTEFGLRGFGAVSSATWLEPSGSRFNLHASDR
jgi:hypothetical protein